jgi:electron transfer flavoprotein beta subunit
MATSMESFMNIIVLIKQVPNTSEVKIDPDTGSLIREGVESIINPEDRHALEAALRIKDSDGSHVTALSMGPPQAVEVVCEAIATGADRGILLTDRAFAGADTWATSTALGLAIKKIGHFDLILAGRQAIDGDTAQIGPQVAEFLGIPQLTYVSGLDLNDSGIVAERFFGNNCERILAPTPVLVTVVSSINFPRHPTLSGIFTATSDEAPIEVWDAADIGAKAQELGLLGSLTQVIKTFTPKQSRKTVFLEGAPSDIAAQLIDALKKKDLRFGD